MSEASSRRTRSHRLQMVITPFLVIGMLQISGCLQQQRQAPPPPGGTYLSTTAGVTFEQSVKLEDGSGNIAGLAALGEVFRPAHKPSTIYIAAGSSGAVVSENGGASWRILPIPLAVTRDLVVLRNGVLVAVGSDSNGQGFIIRSQDNGQNWEEALTIPVPVRPRKIQLFSQNEVPSVVLTIEPDPFNPERIYAGSNLGSIFAGDQSGKVWRKIYTFSETQSIDRIIPSPHKSGELLLLAAGQLFRLQDGQQTQLDIKVPVNPPATPEAEVRYINLGRIYDAVFDAPRRRSAAGPSPPLFIAAQGGAAVSVNWGTPEATWQELRLPLDHSQKFNRAAIAISPTNEQRMFASFNSILYRSEDGGVSWNLYDFNLPSHVISAILIDPANPARVLVVTTPLSV